MQSNINYYKWMVICLVMIVFGIGVGFIGFPKFLHNMIKGVRDSTVLQRRNACNAFEIETISEVKTAISDAFDCAKISFRCGFRDKITERFCLRFEGRSKWHRVLKQNLNEPGVSRKKKNITRADLLTKFKTNIQISNRFFHGIYQLKKSWLF